MNDTLAITTLILLGHGSTKNDGSEKPVYQHAAELRRRGLFAEVREAFWKQEPKIAGVLDEVRSSRVIIVPLFISEGYFTEEAIPEALGFKQPGAKFLQKGIPQLDPPNSGPLLSRPAGTLSSIPNGGEGRGEEAPRFRENTWLRTKIINGREMTYTKPVGTHPRMTDVLLHRAAEVVALHPFPGQPRPADTSLFIAGHGTERNAQSRLAIEQQVELIRARNLFAEVQPCFMEETPRIADIPRLAVAKKVVVVPFFISDGLHVTEDIPVLLGEPEAVVRKRLAAGQPTWRNPTERNGKLIWFAPAVGSDPGMAEVILELAQS